MAQATIPGSLAIEAFDSANTTWKRWLQRLQGAFMIFGIKDQARVPYLLHYVGPTAFDMLSDRLDPVDPFTGRYDDLVRCLQEYYAPAPLEIAENFTFHQRKQQEDESVQQYVAALRKLSIHCKFGNYLNTALRNQLVFGLRNKKAQSRLLEKTDLDFDEAVRTAVTMELSDKSSAQMKETSAEAAGVAYLKAGKKPPRKMQVINGRSRRSRDSKIRDRCGKGHLANKCNIDRSVRCHSCGKLGHLRVVCFKNTSSTNNLEEMLSLEHANYRDKFLLSMEIEGKKVEFELDSGAAVTVMSGVRKPLLGREWIRQFNGHVFLACNAQVNTVTVDAKSKLQAILEKYRNIRSSEFASIKDIQVHLKLKKDASPIFVRARPVPFKLQMLVEKELDTLEQAGIIEKVESSKWATPIVPILKKDGKIRICGDYKATLNRHLIVDEYPFPAVDELFMKLANGKKFSKIDLKQAYLQLEIAPEDRELLTISTSKGLYKVNRMMYGIAPGPTIWQRKIENILQGIPGVAIFFDDIVITGSTDTEHLTRLEEVLSRLHKFNVRINLEKSKFFLDKVDYCGYVVDRVGVHKDNRKIEAIQNMPRPKDVSEIRAFTGMINYYGRFIQNLSSILHPLNKLLQKEVRFVWSKECETAFNKAKAAFTSKQMLVHFNPKLPLVLATDASSYGVGAVLSHRYPDGSEKVIQFASQTFSKVQSKYSQIDKEAFAIIFGVKKFVQFLYGNKFTLITDHRPLVQIFSPSQSLPIYSAMRMQHYAIFLQGYNYEIEYRKSERHANADCLSRLPVDAPQTVADTVDAYQLEVIETLPVTASRIEIETRKDKTIRELLEALQTGKVKHKSKRFNIEQNEFSLQNNVIMRRSRVYIPKTLQAEVLKELHLGHFGVVKMKGLARSHCWWPAIDKDIENLVEVHLWEAPSAPMQRVHVDFAGPFLGKMFLLMVDAFSKWPEVHIVQDITAKTTIAKCRGMFAAYGLPKVIVTDNGRTFVSSEFQRFLQINGIEHKRTSPFNPATNGQSREPVRSNSPVTLDTENPPEVLENVAPVSSQTNQDVNRETILETQRRSARTKRRPDFFSERTEK
ncbi:uncharacterized protein K02A2.6-like [Nylanderia fulva]|uniref:uncharacterized protein K02A2.6-like n=1 Tax=Nylanderia fulva TaxID=613905 RepID=UPI0010FBA8C0|nr:uncharacterized protein K02A2.6-like [Nylanderia fulva]